MSERKKTDNQFYLLGQKRFLPFFVTQFLGAFNDNVFRYAFLSMVAYQSSELAIKNIDTFNNISAGLFILPFFLFSATAGQWIDKNEKSLSIRRIKLLEIVLMLFAGASFYYGQIYFLLLLIFLMGAQSTLFGPAKYSYIPQHLNDEELVAGNGLVQMGTYVAILVGMMLGGILIGSEQGRVFVAASIVSIALTGYIASRFIPETPSKASELKINWNIFTETWRNIAFIHKDRTVFLAVIGVSWFWFLGSIYTVQLFNYAKTSLGGTEEVAVLLLTLFTIGIGTGSLLCNWLSGKKVEIGLVPFGSLGLTVFGIDLFFARPDYQGGELVGALAFMGVPGSARLIIDIFVIGMFGSFYIVPLMALVQQRSEPAHLSRVIAGNNILNALLMVFSAVLAIALLNAGLSIAELFLIVAVMNAAVGIYIFRLVPEFLMRFLVWILIHSIYHVKKHGLENIPDEGPAVLVCNHVSYVDALIIAGCVRRPVRFVMYYKIFNIPVLSFIFRTAGAIPIAGKHENPELMEKAFVSIDMALRAGDVVCIFPEGKLTSDGKMNNFRPGIERIIESTPVPVISMALNGLWGSVFSRQKSFVLFRILKGIRSRIDLVVAPGMKPEVVTAAGLQQEVASLLISEQ